MPKSNRPLVRDGRIQAPKKRTDRSYLRPTSDAPDAAPEPEDDAALDEISDAPEALATVAAPTTAFAPPAAAKVAAAPKQVPTKLPTAVRAIQQQGVRKRGDVDLSALASRDTAYAYHELRRIAVLATMVIVTLVVLWVVLR